MLTHDKIQRHIDELDMQIPKEDAELLIRHDGHSTCEVFGNYIGYLGFGIEMLKAAEQDIEPPAESTGISFKCMEVTQWGLHIDRFVRREDVRKFIPGLLIPRPMTWKDHLDGFGAIFCVCFVCLCLLIGFGDVLVWLWHLVF